MVVNRNKILARYLWTGIVLLLFAFLSAQRLHAEITSETQQLPDPYKLETDWWQYFEKTDDNTFSERSEKFRAVLTGIESDSNKEQIDQILAFLKVYEKLRLNGIKVQPTPELQGKYTFQDLLTNLQKQKNLVDDAELKEEKIKQEESNLDKEKELLDTAKLDYIEKVKKSATTLELGLDIIQHRFSLEINRHRTENQKKNLVAQKAIIQWYDENLLTAYTRLVITPETVSQLNKTFVDLSSSLGDANKNLLAIRNQLLVFDNDQSDIANARENLLKLKQMFAENHVQLLSLQLADAKLTLLLINLEQDRNNFDRKVARSYLKDVTALVNNQSKSNKITKRLIQKELAAAVAQADVESADIAIKDIAKQRIETANQLSADSNEITALLNVLEIKSALLDKRLRTIYGTSDNIKAQTIGTLADSYAYVDSSLSKTLFEINETPVTSYSLMRFVFIMIVAWFISSALKRFLSHVAERYKTMSESAIYTLARIVSIIIVVVGFLIALTSIGIDVTKFALIASALSIGIGFGLQNMINNFVSGIILLFERSLKVGDFVELGTGLSGMVTAINIRSTVVKTNDNVDIIVPNSEFVSSQLINWTMQEAFLRIHVPFGVAYGSDKELVKKVVLDAAEQLPHTLTNKKLKTQVWLTGFGESSLDFELVVWLKPESVKRPGATKAEYNWAIETALVSHGIEIPFPQRDLHVRSGTLGVMNASS